MKKYILPLLLIVAAWGATQCVDENKPQKKKEKLEIAVPEEGHTDLTSGSISHIKIQSGNGDYKIDVSDPEKADVRLSEDKTALLVRGKESGSVQVTVTDRTTGQQKTFTLNIVKPTVGVSGITLTPLGQEDANRRDVRHHRAHHPE